MQQTHSPLPFERKLCQEYCMYGVTHLMSHKGQLARLYSSDRERKYWNDVWSKNVKECQRMSN